MAATQVTKKRTAKPPAKPADDTPRYMIRDTIFLNHRYVMASESSPVMISTVTRPNVKWEPLNEAAAAAMDKMIERLSKIAKPGEVPTAAHLGIRSLKRSVMKFRGQEPDPEDIDDDEEPQDAPGVGVVVHAPKDTVAVLRAASGHGIRNLDGSSVQGQGELAGEPEPGEEEPAEQPALEQPAEEVPVEEPSADTPAEEIPTEEVPDAEGTLAGQQTPKKFVKPPAKSAPRKPVK